MKKSILFQRKNNTELLGRATKINNPENFDKIIDRDFFGSLKLFIKNITSNRIFQNPIVRVLSLYLGVLFGLLVFTYVLIFIISKFLDFQLKRKQKQNLYKSQEKNELKRFLEENNNFLEHLRNDNLISGDLYKVFELIKVKKESEQKVLNLDKENIQNLKDQTIINNSSLDSNIKENLIKKITELDQNYLNILRVESNKNLDSIRKIFDDKIKKELSIVYLDVKRKINGAIDEENSQTSGTKDLFEKLLLVSANNINVFKNYTNASCCSKDFRNEILKEKNKRIYENIQKIFLENEIIYDFDINKYKEKINQEFSKDDNNIENINKFQDLLNSALSEIITDESRRNIFIQNIINSIKNKIKNKIQLGNNGKFDEILQKIQFGKKTTIKLIYDSFDEMGRMSPLISKLKEELGILNKDSDEAKKLEKDIRSLDLYKQIISVNATYESSVRRERIKKEKIIYAIWLSFYSILATLMLFKIASFYKFDDTKYNLSFFDFFDAKVPLLNNSSFWFITCVTSSFLFSLCATAIVKKQRRLEDADVDQESYSDFFRAFLFNIVKDFTWAVIVSIMTTGGGNKANLSFSKLLIAILCASFISFRMFLSKVDLFNPIGSDKDLEKISNIKLKIEKTAKNTIINSNSQDQFLLTIKEKKKSEEKNIGFEKILDNILYIFIFIFCANNKNRLQIDKKRFLAYFLLLFCVSFFVGIFGFFIRKYFAQFISRFEFLKFEFGIYIDGKFIDIFNNKNGMIFICLFDCIFSIICTIIIGTISLKLFIALDNYIHKNQSYTRKKILDDLSSNQNSCSMEKNECINIRGSKDDSGFIQRLYAKVAFLSKMLALLIINTICFHIITQIKQSMFEYHHESFESLFLIGCLLIILFSVFLIITNSFDSGLFGTRCPCKEISKQVTNAKTNNDIDENTSLTLYLVKSFDISDKEEINLITL